MDSNFNFEVRADDVASDVLQQINDKVKALQPELAKTRTGLALGGSESEEGLETLSDKLKGMSIFAKQNVQFIGDMVPPLKMVTGFTGDLAGKILKFGAMGAAAYGVVKGISAVGGAMSDAADDAYSLNVASKNAGMSVRDFSQLSGAMRLLGTDSKSAQGSVEGLYKTFNDALQGRNSNALAVMGQINAPIVRNADGTADVLKTMESLASIFPKLSPQNQKTVADSLGLDANGLQLLREGVRLKALLAKSDKVGLTVDPAVNEQLTQFDRALNEASASWDGFKSRMSQKIYAKIDDDGGLSNMVNGFSDMLENGFDNISIGRFSGQNKGKDSDLMRRAKDDPEFKKQLDSNEIHQLEAGVMTNKTRPKYQKYFDEKDATANPAPGPSQPNDGSQLINRPASSNINPQSRSVRNNNPWNLRYAGQRGANPAGGNFAAFPSPEAGLLAADRQLQLYGSGKAQAARGKPLTTLKDIISVASPKNENDTRQMIIDASKEMQVSPDQQLNLTDPRERARVLHAVFEREGNNPWSTDQISNLITSQNNSMANSPLVTPAPNQDAAGQEVNSAVKALQEKGFKVEITLVNDQTGERQTYNANTGGKVATAMTFP